jgi:hypothetical protein
MGDRQSPTDWFTCGLELERTRLPVSKNPRQDIIDPDTMEKQLKEFMDTGYFRIQNAVTPDMIERILDTVDGLEFKPVFKDAIGDNQMDAFRQQAHFGENRARPFKELRKRLTQIVSSYRKNWEPKNWVVLWSKAGGNEQAPHQDFPKREVTHARAGVGFTKNKAMRITPSIQAGIIVALMPDTELVVYHGCFNDAVASRKRTLLFQAGEAIIFRGDLVHSGAAFAKDNYRIHAALTVKGVPWDENATEAVPMKTEKCLFCPEERLTSAAIHSHMRYCIQNPKRGSHLKTKRERNKKTRRCERCELLCVSVDAYYKHKKKCAAATGAEDS